jgi:hypothetical protein
MEAYANALCLAPNQLALIMPIIPIHDQLELARYVQRTFDVESSPSRGHIANTQLIAPPLPKLMVAAFKTRALNSLRFSSIG